MSCIKLNKVFLVLGLVFCISSTASATLYLSVPDNTNINQNFTIVGEETTDTPVDVQIQLTNSSELVESVSINDSVGQFKTTINASENKFSSGKYDVSVNIFNESEDLNQTSVSQIAVFSEAPEISFVPLTSKEISQCPLENSLNGECKLFGIETSENTSSALRNLSASGKPRTATISGANEQKYVGIVDTQEEGKYDKLFWDDDPRFLEDSETGDTEKSFLTENDAVVEFLTANTTAKISIHKIGQKTILSVSPTEQELPLREGSSLTYAIYAEKDNSPIQNYQSDVVYTDIDTQETFDATPDDSQTDTYGLTGTNTIENLESGKYRLNVNNLSSTAFSVNSFDINYRLWDGSTQSRKKVFKPGDSLEVETSPVSGEQALEPDSVKIELVDPSGNRIVKEPDGKSTTFEIDNSVPVGKATLIMTVTVNGETKTETTSIEIKRYRLHTIPLKEGSYGPQKADFFAPNTTGYAFVSAVKLGTFGSVNDLTRATFYDINNPSTSKDECQTNVQNLTGAMDGEEVKLDITERESVASSDLFSGITDQIPEGMNTQCVVKFELPDKEGFFSGEIVGSRINSSKQESDSMGFSLTNFRVRASTYTLNGDREWEYGPNQTVALKPDVYQVENGSNVPAENITSASITDISGENEVTNTTFYNSTEKSSGPYLAFDTPASSGSYRVEFRVSFETTNSSGMIEEHTASGTDYFRVKLMDVDVDSDSYRYSFQENITLNVKAETPGGSPKQGTNVELDAIRNLETRTDVTDETSFNSNITDSEGNAQITLRPAESWEEGSYNVKIKAKDSSGNTGTDYEYFRVQKYYTSVDTYRNGSICRWSCQLVEGDTIKLQPSVRRADTENKLDFEVLESNSTLLRRSGYDYSEVDLQNQTQSSKKEALKLSTDNIGAGTYRIKMLLKLENGETKVVSDHFQLKPFALSFQKMADRRYFQTDENITIQANISEKRDFNISLEDLGTYNTDNEYNLTQTQQGPVEKEFVNTNSGKFNITVPYNAAEGFHHAQIVVKSNGSTAREHLSFNVKNMVLDLAEEDTAAFGGKLSNSTTVSAERFKTTAYNYLSEVECENVFSEEYSFEGGEIAGSCDMETELQLNREQEYHVLLHNDSRLYVSSNKVFNQSDDLVNRLELYEEFTGPQGYSWNLTGIRSDWDRFTLHADDFTREPECSSELDLWNLDFNGDTTGLYCWAAVNYSLGGSQFDAEDYNVLVNRNQSTVYISNDSTFNEADDLALDLSTGETTSADSLDRKWEIASIDNRSAENGNVRLESTNGFSNGIIVENSTNKEFYGGPFNLPKIENEADLDGDGEKDDTAYVIGTKSGGSWNSVRISYDRNFTIDDSLKLEENQNGTVNGEGEAFYTSEFENHTSVRVAKQIDIYSSTPRGYSFRDPVRKPNKNYSFPVIVEYPNGTNMEDARLGVNRIEREYHGSVKEISSNETKETDKNGVGFLEINLTDPDSSTDVGTYTIVPEANSSNTDGFKSLDEWDSPQVDVKLFSIETEEFLKIVSPELDSYSNQTQMEKSTGFETDETSENYRVKKAAINESEGSCTDLNSDGECGDLLNIFMWNDSIEENSKNVDVNRFEMDDDKDFTEPWDEETGGDLIRIYGDIYLNKSYIGDRDRMDDFVLFSEAENKAQVYLSNGLRPNRSVSVMVKARDIVNSSKIVRGNISVSGIRYDGLTYEAEKEIVDPTNSNGAAIFELNRTDFKGNSSKWPQEESVEVFGNVSNEKAVQEFSSWVYIG